MYVCTYIYTCIYIYIYIYIHIQWKPESWNMHALMCRTPGSSLEHASSKFDIAKQSWNMPRGGKGAGKGEAGGGASGGVGCVGTSRATEQARASEHFLRKVWD